MDPYDSSLSSPNNPFPHSILRTRETQRSVDPDLRVLVIAACQLADRSLTPKTPKPPKPSNP